MTLAVNITIAGSGLAHTILMLDQTNLSIGTGKITCSKVGSILFLVEGVGLVTVVTVGEGDLDVDWVIMTELGGIPDREVGWVTELHVGTA